MTETPGIEGGLGQHTELLWRGPGGACTLPPWAIAALVVESWDGAGHSGRDGGGTCGQGLFAHQKGNVNV